MRVSNGTCVSVRFAAMSEPNVVPDLDVLPAAAIKALGAALRKAGYDDAYLAKCEAIAPKMLDAVRLPMVHWWLRRQDDDAAVLARLFGYGDAVEAAALDRALGQELELVKALRAADILRDRSDEAGIESAIRIVPFEGLVVASDPMHGDDPVMGPGATTTELARMIPPDAGSVLDVGGGAGSLALVAASRGAKPVVAVDLHPRAAMYCRFNATLNDLTLEIHTGDLTAPVRDRRFDLVVSQPPFVVHPPKIEATTYLHGGAMGDELAMRLLGELPGVMADGGLALVLFDSPVREASPLWQRVAEAHDEGEMQAILFAAHGNSPNIQAIGYAASSHPALDERYATAALQYRDHLAAHGIDRTDHVLLTLRRVPGEPSMSVTIELPRLDQLDAQLIAQTWAAVGVASLPEAELLQRTIGLPEGTWLIHEEGDGEQRLKIRLPPGRGDEEVLSDAAALLVDLVRQPSPLALVVQRYAEACGATPADVQSNVIDFVRQSLVSGRLVAATPKDTSA